MSEAMNQIKGKGYEWYIQQKSGTMRRISAFT